MALTVPSRAGFDLGRQCNVMICTTISGTASHGGNQVALSQFPNFVGTLLTHSTNQEIWLKSKVLNSLFSFWNDLLGTVRTFSSAPDQCNLELILTHFSDSSEARIISLVCGKHLKDPSVKSENIVILIPKILGEEPHWNNNIEVLQRWLTTMESYILHWKVSRIWKARHLQAYA